MFRRSDLSVSHPVTLRGMLSTTAGIGVPGDPGYSPGARTLCRYWPARRQRTLQRCASKGAGSRYAYSVDGYAIVHAIIQDTTHLPSKPRCSALMQGPV